MFTLSRNKYKQGILAALALLFMVPVLASAAVQWGTVTQNVNGQIQGVRFEHQIINYGNGVAPGNLAINAVVDVEDSWVDPAMSAQAIFFIVSKDETLDVSDRIMASAQFKNGSVFTDTFKVAFEVKNTTTQAFPGLNQPLSLAIINQGLGNYADANDENQTFYACAMHGPTNLGFLTEVNILNSLGCRELKLSIINEDMLDDNTNPPAPTGGGTNPEPPDQQGTGAMEFDKLKNPLCATTGDSTICSSPIESVTDFIERILNIVVMIGMPIVVLALIWSGFLYVKAQGNSDKIGEAHKTLLWTVVGAGLLMGSWAIARAIKQTVVDIGTGAGLSMLVEDYHDLG